MKKIMMIFALGAAVAASALTAGAEPITGSLSVSGTASFDNNDLLFNSLEVGLSGDTAGGKSNVSGTFASYLTDGQPVTGYPGVSFAEGGSNTVPSGFWLFQVTENGETFEYYPEIYSATYTDGSKGAMLYISTSGYITGTGAVDYDETPVTVTFSGAASGPDVIGNFVMQTTATTPEPGSLLLLGTGLIGAAAAARRRFLAV